MRAADAAGSDGPANLLAGFRVAADPSSRGKGVLVVMNDKINSARDVAKRDATHIEAFDAPAAGPLGTVDADRVVYHRELVGRHTKASEFDIDGLRALPRVDIVLTYQDAPGDLVRAAVDQGAAGIVLATAGAGSTSGTQADGVAYALARQVVVVFSSRTGAGRISPPGLARLSGADQRTEELRIAAEGLPPLKARILLMLVLTRTRDAAEIQRMFLEY
jgi:L-asparaginase